jgi:hypothetical protein
MADGGMDMIGPLGLTMGSELDAASSEFADHLPARRLRGAVAAMPGDAADRQRDVRAAEDGGDVPHGAGHYA